LEIKFSKMLFWKFLFHIIKNCNFKKKCENSLLAFMGLYEYSYWNYSIKTQTDIWKLYIYFHHLINFVTPWSLGLPLPAYIYIFVVWFSFKESSGNILINVSNNKLVLFFRWKGYIPYLLSFNKPPKKILFRFLTLLLWLNNMVWLLRMQCLNIKYNKAGCSEHGLTNINAFIYLYIICICIASLESWEPSVVWKLKFSY